MGIPPVLGGCVVCAWTMATVVGVAEIGCEGTEVPVSPAPSWELMLVGGSVSSDAAKVGGGNVELVVEVFKTGFLRGGSVSSRICIAAI